MGKTTRWFRSLLGYKKSSSESSPAASKSEKEKKPKWGLTKSNDSAKGSSRYNNAATTTTTTTTTSEDPYVEGLDANKHAIAVAAATAAVAEAALAAAHAAAEVVRLTSGSRSGGGVFASGGGEQCRELAAIKIQSAFRAYLARRALRALKGLVKLQALVRGRIVRKQSADMLRRMQAMARIQARACATRAYSSESSHSTVKSSQFHHPGNASPKRYDLQQPPSSFNQNPKQMQRSGSKPNIINHNAGERTYLTSNWLDRWMEECTWSNRRDTSKHGCGDDDKNAKILEIDTWKPHQNPRQSDKNFRSSQYFSAWNDSRRGCFETALRHPMKYQNPDPSLSSGDVSSLRSIRFPPEVDQVAAWNVENSPQVHSANSRPRSSSRRGAFSPSRSECARSFFGDYLSYPNYMANTESSRAKFRSQSAPKQRLQPEKLGAGRNFVRSLWDAETCSEKDSTSHFNYGSKGYSGSARLDRLGTPIHDSSGGFSSSYGVRS